MKRITNRQYNTVNVDEAVAGFSKGIIAVKGDEKVYKLCEVRVRGGGESKYVFMEVAGFFYANGFHSTVRDAIKSMLHDDELYYFEDEREFGQWLAREAF